MNFDGEVGINASRAEVWEFLTNPEAISKCAPGLEELEIVEPDKKFKVTGSVGLGTVKVRFVADAEWLELVPLEHARVKGHGTAPGSAVDGSAEMNLSDREDGSTLLSWKAEVIISGTIASLASRLMGGVTKRLAKEFFDCVRKNVEV